MTPAIVSLHEVCKRYRTGRVDTEVLKDITLEVSAGELLAVVGTSGSGKSTLLNIIGGLDRQYTGRALVDGRDLTALSDRELSRLRNERVGFVFQQFHLLEHLSCLENVALPSIFCRSARASRRLAWSCRSSSSNASERARQALDRVGLGERVADLPANLSGGQKQRVAIARALFSRPQLLLCDEPTGNLDSATGQQIIELFTSLNREDGITLIIVTHESRVSSAAHRVVRLEDGRIVSSESAIGVEPARPGAVEA